MPRWLLALLKWLGILTLSIALLMGGVAFIAYAVNARDEGLSAEARSLLAVPPNELRPEDNLFVQLAGSHAPSGGSTTAAGLAVAARFERAAAGTPTEFLEEYGRLIEPDPAGLQFAGAAQFCSMREGSVWADAPAHEADVASLSIDNAELYHRYLDLPRQRGFYDFTAGTVQTIYYADDRVRCLFLADVALRLRSASSAVRTQALAALTQDILVWRSMLTGHGDLISKMLPVAYLHSDYLVLSDAIADPAFALPEVTDANEVVPLFEPPAWDIGNVFPVELRLFVKNLVGAAQPDRPRFFQPNATTNLRAGRMATLMKLAAPDPKHNAALASLESEDRSEYGYWPFMHLYNPIGHYFASLRGPWADYLRRAWDGAALQRLVRLGYEIRRQRIAPDAIAAFIQAHPEIGSHPGDGRAFEYDAAKHELRMHPLAHKPPEQRRYAIPVWRAAGG